MYKVNNISKITNNNYYFTNEHCSKSHFSELGSAYLSISFNRLRCLPKAIGHLKKNHFLTTTSLPTRTRCTVDLGIMLKSMVLPRTSV